MQNKQKKRQTCLYASLKPRPTCLSANRTFQSILRAPERHPEIRPAVPPQEGGILWKLGS